MEVVPWLREFTRLVEAWAAAGGSFVAGGLVEALSLPAGLPHAVDAVLGLPSLLEAVLVWVPVSPVYADV